MRKGKKTTGFPVHQVFQTVRDFGYVRQREGMYNQFSRRLVSISYEESGMQLRSPNRGRSCLQKGTHFLPILLLFLLFLLSGCASLDSLLYLPVQTPQQWLERQPYVTAGFGGRKWLLMQPSSTLFVYLLGVVAIVFGIRILRMVSGKKSAAWWSASLILWGAGALLAGTSYELFSYEIKCAAQNLCLWTSWWEIGYLLLSLSSVNAMAAAQAARLEKPAGNRLRMYAAVNNGLYIALVAIGTALPVRFLISFEMLILFSAPTILIFILLNWKGKSGFDRSLMQLWIALIGIIAAYFAYYLSGLTGVLWNQGVWFSENDILHIGLILWMVFISRTIIHNSPSFGSNRVSGKQT